MSNEVSAPAVEGRGRPKLQRIHHAAIICSDYAVSKHFYNTVLGLDILAENYRAERDSWKLDLALPDGGQVELFSFNGAPARPSYPEAQGLRHLAFEVEQLDEWVAWLEAHSIAVEAIRTDEFTGKRFTFFADPDALPLELYER
ncbi:SMU1112c/YaeR family gloxylase I-like metalloprotein [Oceanobacter kriegii]|uniref:SMU1112c/YaeR family gloxylase I-like metalloprotein n=1 Tax=Oceanobacter kriegii TaxID=64972 RepID=UPI0003F931F9|nr:VOC family protein [Oceanobacter kriegii]